MVQEWANSRAREAEASAATLDLHVSELSQQRLLQAAAALEAKLKSEMQLKQTEMLLVSQRSILTANLCTKTDQLKMVQAQLVGTSTELEAARTGLAKLEEENEQFRISDTANQVSAALQYACCGEPDECT